jgi:hypothetical protein
MELFSFVRDSTRENGCPFGFQYSPETVPQTTNIWKGKQKRTRRARGAGHH